MTTLKMILTSAALTLATATIAHADGHSQHHGQHHGDAVAQQSIVEIAASNDSFDTLVAAVKAAGLAETLTGTGPFTVFAPTDDAFDALPAGTLARLLKPENKAELVAILTYHVVPGAVKAADVVGLSEAATVHGNSIKITASDGGVMVDGAHVVATDIEASNGIIHIIDKVILPQS